MNFPIWFLWPGNAFQDPHLETLIKALPLPSLFPIASLLLLPVAEPLSLGHLHMPAPQEHFLGSYHWEEDGGRWPGDTEHPWPRLRRAPTGGVTQSHAAAQLHGSSCSDEVKNGFLGVQRKTHTLPPHLPPGFIC